MAYINGEEISDGAIIHMLGYCDGKKFIDAIKNYPEFGKRNFIKLAKIIDDVWSCGLVNEIKEALDE